MSDTVPAAVITGALTNLEWTFLPSGSLPSADVLHINGAVFADAPSPGLLVAFSTLSPDLQMIPAAVAPRDDGPSTVAGYATALPDTQPMIVAGALQQHG